MRGQVRTLPSKRPTASLPRNFIPKPKMSKCRQPEAAERISMNQDVSRVSVEVGGTEISFETGKLAKQASGAVVVSADETMVLATATAGNQRDVDFLPLTVDVE